MERCTPYYEVARVVFRGGDFVPLSGVGHMFAAMIALDLPSRLAELPHRLHRRGHAAALSWNVTAHDRARVRIAWPSRYEWTPAAGITETLRAALARQHVLEIQSTPQTWRGSIMLECVVDDRPQRVVLDYSDRAEFINQDALARCSLYIKLQFRADGYADPRIIRGGYVASGLHYYRYYRALRQRSRRRRTIDVFGRFGYQFEGDLRRRAADMLNRAPDLHFVGTGERVRYSRFLREAASARLCLGLPGNGPFTYRVAEFLGLGCCMLAPRYPTSMHVPLEPGVHYVAIARDMSDLLDVCRYYLAHDDARERIACAGRDFFDRYLHCEQIASYYLRTMLDRFGTTKESVASGSSVA